MFMNLQQMLYGCGNSKKTNQLKHKLLGSSISNNNKYIELKCKHTQTPCTPSPHPKQKNLNAKYRAVHFLSSKSSHNNKCTQFSLSHILQ